MIFSYNSRIEEYKTPFGAIPSGDSIRFKVTAKDDLYIENMFLEVMKNGDQIVEYPMPYSGKKYFLSEFSTTVHITSVGIYWYRFKVFTEAGVIILTKGSDGGIVINGKKWFQQTVYEPDFRTPKSVHGGTIYHIFVDRFNKGSDTSAYWDKDGVQKNWGDEVTIVDKDGVFRANDFYGGNFQGIIDKLDYLKSLGVTIIYLSPIFKSSSNHRYDTGDYSKIDELLGSEERFQELIDKAKAMGMGVLLDGVFNHTGADSLYFNKFNKYDSIGAYQGIKSPYFDWYYFNNFPDDYACWWGITVTPTVNKRSSTYRQFIFGKGGVLDKWTGFGLAGWRLDVVDELEQDFVNILRSTVKAACKDNVIIGEVWEDASTKVAYGTMRPYLLGNQLDGVMNYPFKKAILEYSLYGNKDSFVDTVMDIVENYPRQALNCSMTLIGSHDTVRALNALSGVNVSGTNKSHRLSRMLTPREREVSKLRLFMASVLQYILPGIPSVYYGDEIGMEGFEDPINRRPFAWDDIDEELLEHYRQLGRIRQEYHDELVGDIRIIPHNKLLIITRNSKHHTLLVICNHTKDNLEWQMTGCIDVMSGEKCENISHINPHSFRILYC